MTKTQISIRVSPDTLSAIDAEAQAAGTSRGHIIDRWLSAQAQAREANAVAVEQQAWYRAGHLATVARSRALGTSRANALGDGFLAMQSVVEALSALADAIDVLAGTAPE